jgi:hypothetical protein
VSRAAKTLAQMKANPLDWRIERRTIKPVYVRKFVRLVEEGIAE